MTTTGAAGLLRNPEAPKRATLLELLFDVVYVAALALMSMRLAHDVSWAGAGQILIILMAVWWIWSVTAITTDVYDPQRPLIQGVIGSAMVGVVLMAAALPSAFSGLGLLFAGGYVGVHVARGVCLVTALRGNEAQGRALRFLFWFAVSGIAWVGGALAGQPARGAIWAIGIAIDYLAGAFRYPTPWLGRVPVGQYAKASEHLGERYQQFVILALGDLVLVPTLRISSTGFTGDRVIVFLAAFATTLLLWQIYVFRAGSFLQAATNKAPARSTRWAPYTHLVMVAGVVVTAAGFDLALNRPTGPAPAGWVGAILGGPALFLIGRMTFEYEVFGRVSWSRLGWLVVLIAVAPALVLLPPVLVTVLAAAILLGIAVSDAFRSGNYLPTRFRRRLPEPGRR